MWREIQKKKEEKKKIKQFLKQVIIFEAKGRQLVHALRLILGVLKTVDAEDARIS